MATKINILMHLLAVIFYVDTFEVERKLINVGRDTFDKGVYSYGNDKIDIAECNATYVDGVVEKDYNNKEICHCGYGGTFYLNASKVPPKATCITSFGLGIGEGSNIDFIHLNITEKTAYKNIHLSNISCFGSLVTNNIHEIRLQVLNLDS